MFGIEAMRDAFAHMEWADAAVWKCALALPQAAQDPPIRDRLHHIHATQRRFLHLWMQVPSEIPAPSAFPDLAALARWACDGYARLRRYSAGLGDSDLRRELHVPWRASLEKRFGAPLRRAEVGESMFQVIGHTAHHRGQIATRLRELGGEPPTIDYIAWVWTGRPGAAWPAPAE